ncbi:hypothetical protein R3P38DRAFT_540044 [Favolaschia claudopus]|uniref:F-box domain-containing protein n=1 Tax=Favolaschia claudopus TaxID=2862362 RepID=A0AAW0CGS5_9AGAR
MNTSASTNMTEDFSFSFPDDLEREIFETAAVRNRKEITTLLQVCSRVHAWIEPLLYRIMVISSKADYDWLDSVIQSKQSSYLRNAVRHVYLSQMSTKQQAYKDFLMTISEVVNLLLDQELDLDLLPALDQMNLRKLDINVPPSPSEWARLILTRPLLTSVTHLSLYQRETVDGLDSQSSSGDDWIGLAALPSLTHLGLSDNLARIILPRVLAECSRLLLAVVLFWTVPERPAATGFAESLRVLDPRLVVMLMRRTITVDWTAGANSGDDFWIRADAFVSRKRKGEIDKTVFLLDETK